MLAFYATRFPTVEINNTFYRLPRESVLLEWAARVSDGFAFAIKASQRITRHARLKPDYRDSALGEWARCVADQPWTEAYVYFKHDEAVGSGPPAIDAFVAAVTARE